MTRKSDQCACRGSDGQPKCDLGLADMQDMPMSAQWYWCLGYLRDTIYRLRSQHNVAVHVRRKRDPALTDLDWFAQRNAQSAIEYIDRLRRTMERAGVLLPDSATQRRSE